jgi:Tfp pilus assembly protein PilF
MGMGNQEQEFGHGDRVSRAAVFGLLAALVLISYGSMLKADFVYDDHNQLVQNPSIQSLRNIPRFFTHPAETIGAMVFEGIYRPLRTTYFAAGYQLWGMNSAAYHGANLFFHLLNSFLLFLLIARLCEAERPALVAALVFAVHPALTEDVCWICSSSDLLCMILYLSALLCWFRARDEAGGKRRAFLVISLVSLGLALLSKEMAVTFPAVIVGIDFWREGFKGVAPRRWLSYAPFVVLTGIYLAIRMNIMSRFAQRGQWGDTPLASAVIIAKAVAYYVGILVYPFKLTILPVIDTNVSLSDFADIFAVLLVICLIVAVLAFRKKYPTATLGIFLFFILLLPISNIIPLTAIVAGRFVYTPSIGFSLVVAAAVGAFESLVQRQTQKRKILAVGAIASIIFLLSANTVIRSLDWQTDLALFKSAVEVAPDNPRARVSLGKEYVLKEDLEAARNQALTALEHDKDHTQAHSLLGRIYWEEGNNDAAAQEFKVVLEDIPHDNYANNALGTIYREQGRLEEALALFEAASNRQPIIWRTLNNAGSVLLELGKPEEARMYFSRALEVRPDSREAAYNMGVALTSLGRSAEAIAFLEGWMSSHSLDSQMLTLMGLTYASENKIDASVDAFRRALEIDPENALAATRLVDYHMSNGEYKDAVVLLKNLVTGNPDSVRERMMYAVALEQTGKLDKAVEQLRAADRLKPNDATIRRMLANTLSKLKEADEASP